MVVVCVFVCWLVCSKVPGPFAIIAPLLTSKRRSDRQGLVLDRLPRKKKLLFKRSGVKTSRLERTSYVIRPVRFQQEVDF